MNAYAILNKVDSRLFKAFLAAATCENFTLAAKEAGLTQSGVSQQVSKLEEQLGASLFQRVNKTVILNENGKILKDFINGYLNELDELLSVLQDKDVILSGKVRYAMPNSCLLSPHLGMLLKKIKSLPDIDLEISINRNSEVYEKILLGNVDFGFVTNKIENPAIQHDFFCSEQLVLVGGKDFKNLSIHSEDIIDQPFIAFDGIDDYLNPWFKHHWPKKRAPNSSELNVAGKISHLHGVITLLENNVGISIVPRHCIEAKLQPKKIFVLDPKNKAPLGSKIFIASIKNSSLPKRVEKIISSFMELL